MSFKRKTYIVLSIFTIIILFLVSFVVYPLFKGIKKNSQDFVSQRKEYALLRIKANYLMDFEKLSKDNQPNLERINTLFVDPEMPVNFICFLERIARESQVSIAISPMASVKGKADVWPFITFRVNLTGSFSSLSRFLGKIETSPWPVENLNLKIGRGKGKTDTVKANLLIKAYTQNLK